MLRHAVLAFDPVLIPALLGLAVFVVWAIGDGALDTSSYAGAVFFAALLAVICAAVPGALSLGVPAAGALVSLVALAGWCGLTILWADDRGAAWEGANRVALYCLVFALFSALPWTPAAARTYLLAWVASISVLAGLMVVHLVGEEPGRYFLTGRLAWPINYSNADAALFLLAAWPALWLAAARGLPALLRGALIGCAGLVAQVALLAQSRGSIAASAVVLAVALALLPGRLRLLPWAAMVAAACLATSPWLLDVYPALLDGRALTETTRDAAAAIFVSTLLLAALGAVVALIDERVELRPALVRAFGWACWAALAVSVVVALAVAATHDPRDRIQREWNAFTSSEQRDSSRSNLASGVGGDRHDVWRVALRTFASAPVAGVGADNFAAEYLRRRSTTHSPRFEHSVELKFLAETGVLGALLLLSFGGFVGWGLARAVRRSGSEARPLVCGAAAAVLYWFVHGSVDWLWEMPALGGFAVAAAALAIGLGETSSDRGAISTRVTPARAVAVLASLAAVPIFVLPYLSDRYVDLASGGWRTDPQLAYERLQKARSLNPLSAEPDLIDGTIAAELGDTARVHSSFERALERNPSEWYAEFELALAAASSGRLPAARAHLRLAERLNPLEPTIAAAREALAADERLRLDAFSDQLYERGQLLLPGTPPAN